MSDFCINIPKLSFSYGKKPILELNNFSLKKGENAFLYGPSGCGKSTFLNLIAGTLPFENGEIFVLDHPLHQMNASAKDKLRGDEIGYIFQNFNLIPYLTILENILLPCRISPHKRKKEKSFQQQALDYIHRLGLKDHEHMPVKDLSLGQQQRVALIRALMGKPSLIIADEPTSALDDQNTTLFLDLLFELAKDQTTSILFVSHDHRPKSYFDKLISLPEINEVKQ